MKTPSSTAGDPTTRPTPVAWSSPFATPHSYTSRPPSLHPTLRPWREFLSLRSFSLPYGYSDALLRLRKNLSHFRFNYVLIALLALFLSLISHPYSLLLFVFLSLAWYALYFSRDSPIVLFGRVFDDRVVAAVLGVVTIVGLVLTGVGLTVLVALVVAVVIVGVHGVFRNSEDLYVDEESIGEGGLVSVVSSQPLRSYARIGLDTFRQMFGPSNELLETHSLQRVAELMNMLPGSASMVAKVEYDVGDWRPYSALSFNVLSVH